MNIKGKIKRIIKTSPAEIQHRLYEKIIILFEKKYYYKNINKYFADDYNFFGEQFAEVFDKFRSNNVLDIVSNNKYTRKLAPWPDINKKKIFKELLPDKFALSLDRANKFLQNEFSFLGVTFKLPDPIPWNVDPVSLKPFPGGFYNDIDIFTNQNPGDVKHVWEVNRLQFLIELAKAYFLTNDKKYKIKIDRLILDWYKKNPYQTGIAWTSALEVAVRALALIWTLHFYRASVAPDPQTIRIILKILYWSGLFLNRHLSIYFSPYNHLIGETAALFAIGFLFPIFKGANEWAAKGLKILTDQVEKQFHPDGGCVEQATFYHHFTLGFYLQTISLLKHNNHSIPSKMLKRVEKALEFSMYMMRPDATFPYLGDIDDARSIYFSNPTNWDFRGFHCLGAVWFNRADMKFISGGIQEEAFWMFSDQEFSEWDKLPAKAPNKTCLFLKNSGYFIFRSGYDSNCHFSFMDCGPLADGVFFDETPSAAHGHADLLSVEIAPFGESILIDPGFSNYRGEYDWHMYFRSTAAHNTVTINGQSQAKQVGILKWSFAPKYKVLATINEAMFSGVTGEHYGFHQLEGKPTHRRYFIFIQQKFWVVLDYFFAQDLSLFDVQWNWHFNDFVVIDLSPDWPGFNAIGKHARLRMLMLKPEQLHPEQKLLKGGDRPDQGWISPTYRNRRPAFLFQQELKARFPLTIPFLFLPERGNQVGQISLKGNQCQILLGKEVFQIFSKNSEKELLIIKIKDKHLKLLKNSPYLIVE